MKEWISMGISFVFMPFHFAAGRTQKDREKKGKRNERQGFWRSSTHRAKLHASDRRPSGCRAAAGHRKLLYQRNDDRFVWLTVHPGRWHAAAWPVDGHEQGGKCHL